MYKTLNLYINQEYIIMVLYAEDIMRKNDEIMDGNISALNASIIMAEKHNGYVIVGDNNIPEGIVTEWDFINKVISKKIDPAKIKIKEIMAKPLIYVEMNTPMDKVADLMANKGIRRLLVINDNKLAGIITSRDILKYFRDYVMDVVEIASKFGIK